MTTTSRSALSRRLGAALSLALAAGTVAIAPGASAASPAPAPAATSAATAVPPEIALPTGFRPEGVAAGAGTTVYAGSVGDGSIVRADTRTGRVSALLFGRTGRSMRGMQYDARSGLLWVVGNDGAQAKVWAIDGRTGRFAREILVPGGAFLNDVVISSRTVWVTDSGVDRLTRITVTPSGRPTSAAPTFLAITGAWPKTVGDALGANGIRQLPDGSLILNNSTAGGLYTVNGRTGQAVVVPVAGGPRLTGGDGLELRGSTLYDVRATGRSEVAVVTLRRTSAGWRATYAGLLRSSRLDVPSTATLAAGGLYAVNARFGVANPDAAAYWIRRLPQRP